jgi:phosphate transport system permease protein
MRTQTKISDFIIKIFIWLFTLIAVGALIWIVGFVLIKGLPNISWNFIVSSDTGILPMIVTTLIIIPLTLIIAAPIGICSAIYLVEYARPGKIVNLIRFATESLAGIPSIIYGLFGYVFFCLTLGFNYSILSGSLTLSIMVLPTIIRTTEEAIKTVPNSYREGSLALGATKLTTIFKIILPSSISGILTAIILSIGRIVGETAAVIFTLGTVTDMPKNLMSSGRTLATHMYNLAREGTNENAAFATAAVLIIVVALINLSARGVAGQFQKKLHSKK